MTNIAATDLIYMDNAASSWPKPDSVCVAMDLFMRSCGANPGRSGHSMSVDAARVVFEAREAAATLFGVGDSSRIAFTHNATHAINMALHGVLSRGDRVVITALEHNSVMRPLSALRCAPGIEVVVAPCNPDGSFSMGSLADALRTKTKLVVATHASNVTGDILPVRDIGELAHARGALLLVDAAQTAGCLPIDLSMEPVDMMAFTGHKGLLGPQGTGGLYVAPHINLQPLIRGGTGSRSESEEQPDFMPDSLESGTPNTVGLAGFSAGIQFILGNGIAAIREREQQLTDCLQRGLLGIDGVTLQGTGDITGKVGIVSFRLRDVPPDRIAHALDAEFHIMTRAGLHCAPAAHRALGSFPAGSIRVSPGAFSTADQVERTVEAVSIIAGRT